MSDEEEQPLPVGEGQQRGWFTAIKEEVEAALSVLMDRGATETVMACLVAHGKLLTANHFIERLVSAGVTHQVLTDIRDAMKRLNGGTNLGDVEFAESRLKLALRTIEAALGVEPTTVRAEVRPSQPPPEVPGAAWARGLVRAGSA